jgi:hypothetical protein
MSCVDIRPDGLERAASGQPLIAAARPVVPVGRWWRWAAAAAVFAPGGGLAYHLLTTPDEDPAPPTHPVAVSQAA